MSHFRFTASRQSLVALAAHCRQAVDPKSPMHMLTTMRMVINKHSVEGTGTDSWRQASMLIDVDTGLMDISGSGICVDAPGFLERVTMMPDGPVVVEAATDGSKVTIVSMVLPRRYAVPAFSSADYPHVPGPDLATPLTEIPASDLLGLLRSTSVAASDDTTRAHVNSVLLEIRNEVVRACATDGHRIHFRSTSVPGSRTSRSFLIPLEATKGLIRVIGDAVADGRAKGRGSADEKPAPVIVGIREGHTYVHVQIGSRVYGFKKVDGQFPPYEQVVPGSFDSYIEVSKAVLLAATKAVAVACDAKTGGVKLQLKTGKVEITASGAKDGESGEDIPCDYAGQPTMIGIKASYIVDALNMLDGDTVVLGLSGHLDPIQISDTRKPDLRSAPTTLAIVMPLRV